MRPREKSAQKEDRSVPTNKAEGNKESMRNAEARARRMEEIRRSVLEEWRWRDPERVE